MIVERIKKAISPGMEIPKPEAERKFTFERWERREGEDVFIFSIHIPHDPQRPNKSIIAASEFESAYAELVATGFLSNQWWVANTPEYYKRYWSPFTTIGGVFELLGIARHERGGYRKIKDAEDV